MVCLSLFSLCLFVSCLALFWEVSKEGEWGCQVRLRKKQENTSMCACDFFCNRVTDSGDSFSDRYRVVKSWNVHFSFHDANKYCQSKWGANLASIHSMEDMKEVNDTFNYVGNGAQFWVGFNNWLACSVFSLPFSLRVRGCVHKLMDERTFHCLLC